MNVAGWSEELMKQWTDAQKQYWNNMTGMGIGASQGKNNESDTPDWLAGVEKIWSQLSPQMPVQANDVMQRVFDMGRTYSRMAEAAFGDKGESSNVMEAWINAMEKGFADWQAQAEQGKASFDAFAMGANPLENWQQMLDKMGMQAFKNVGVEMPDMEAWQAQWQKMVGMNVGAVPPDNMQLVTQLAENYQAAMQTYMSAFSAQGLDSVQALRDRMATMATEGVNVTSLRELYDLWVDVSEEVYGKFAMSDDYQKIYGDLVNAFVALKGGVDAAMAAQTQAMKALGESTLETLLKQQQDMLRMAETMQEQMHSLAERVTNLEDVQPAASAVKTETTPSAAKPAAPVAPSSENADTSRASKTNASKAKPMPKSTAKATPISAEKSAEVVEPTPAKSKAAPKKTAETTPAKPKAAPKKVAAEVAPAKPKAAPKKAAAKKPTKTTPDDLTKIKGLGPKMSDKLIDAGIQTFENLAALSQKEAEALDKKLDARGRLLRDDWVGQASKLA